MPQDFASRHKKKNDTGRPPTSLVFTAGFLLGLFTAFLAWLWLYVPADESVAEDKPTAEIIKDQQIIEMDYQFYDLFPRTEVPVVEEINQQGERVSVPENYAYLLQAGSFQNRDDADRQRAELILMGFDAFLKDVEHESGVWHRVMIGPLDSPLELNRARTRLAELNIESIQMRVKR